MLHTYKISNRNIVQAIVFTVIVFNNIVQQYISVMSYLDELICIGAFIYIFCFKEIKIEYMQILCYTGILILLGLVGNIIFGYQNSFIGIMKDILGLVKIPVISVACMMYADKNKHIDEANSVASYLSKIYLSILSFLAFITLFKDIGLSYDLRHGIYSFKFLFGHPTFLVLAVVIMSAVIVANGPTKGDYFFLFEALFLLIMSMRDKGFGYALLLCIILFLIPNAKKIKKWWIPVAIFGALIISKGKIQEYMSWSWSPRFELYRSGLKILRDCFPFGSGMATFSSYISGEYYAKTYYIYGFFGRNAPVNPGNFADLGDAGLPYFVQFGLIGIALSIFILYKIIEMCKKKYSYFPWKFKASCLLLGYMGIGSLVENVFTNESGATIPLVLFIFLGSYGEKIFDGKQLLAREGALIISDESNKQANN